MKKVDVSDVKFDVSDVFQALSRIWSFGVPPSTLAMSRAYTENCSFQEMNYFNSPQGHPLWASCTSFASFVHQVTENSFSLLKNRKG